MPKQIINLIGLLVCVAVLACGIFLVALPLVAQSFGVDAQVQQVNQTNALYQAQVDNLNKAKDDQAATAASVAALRAQIPNTPQLDTVFGLVARAAETSKVKIQSVAAGDPGVFVPRTSATSLSDQPTAPAPAPAPSPSASADGAVGDAQQSAAAENAQTAQTNTATGATGSNAAAAPSAGRTQVDFTIVVTAANMKQVTAFLDALRAGPRLLSTITSTVAQSSSGIAVNVTALTFLDTTQPATKGSK